MDVTGVNPYFYRVKSSSGGPPYSVNPIAGRCNCRGFRFHHGSECRHLRSVRAQIAREQPTALALALEKAASLSDEQLLILARQHNGTAAGAACWLELAGRRSYGRLL